MGLGLHFLGTITSVKWNSVDYNFLMQNENKLKRRMGWRPLLIFCLKIKGSVNLFHS